MQPVDPSDESDQVSSSGDMSCGSGIPSVPCIALNKPADLPPIPNRLVPSKSTERILDILNQRDSEMRSEGQKESLLSSTPAEKSGGNVAPHDESMNSQVINPPPPLPTLQKCWLGGGGGGMASTLVGGVWPHQTVGGGGGGGHSYTHVKAKEGRT